MKNLGKTIEQLIKVDPNLEKELMSIKNKWKRYPNKTNDYWKELLDFLNSDILMNHPKRMEMKDIINSKRKETCLVYSFEEVALNDKIIGTIPENVADNIRRQDRQSIKVAKLHVEASMTRNLELMAESSRKGQILDIKTKKMWVSLRDHFHLWTKPGNYNIKTKKGLLFLVEQVPHSPPQFVGPGVMKIDPELLKKFFRFMGINPPPDLLDGDNNK